MTGGTPSDDTPATADDERFVSLVTAHQRELRVMLLGLVPHQVDADDLLQEVNLALWRKRQLYDPKQGFLKWAFGFATLEVRRFRSKSAKSRLWFDDETIDLLADDWSDSDSYLEESRSALAACLEKLRSDERLTVEAKYKQQLSMKQIAVDTSKPLSTVYKVLYRALKSLRTCIKQTQRQKGEA